MRGQPNSSPERGGGPLAQRVVEGALCTYIAWGWAPSTKPLRVLVPLPVNGEELS